MSNPQETQGITTNRIDTKPKNKKKLLRIKTGALSSTVGKRYSTPPQCIRTELPVHRELEQQIPTIQSLLLHLEGKRRAENTLIAYEKTSRH